jgi:sulfatase maturation enzyme AslB (radical SAM superfamily)
LGDVRDGFNRSGYSEFEDWLLTFGQHRINDEECKYCFAKRICGGGCYAQSYDRYGTAGPFRDQCLYIKEMVKLNLYYISRMKQLHPDIFMKLTGVQLSKQEVSNHA